jgi:hypothetical protein
MTMDGTPLCSALSWDIVYKLEQRYKTVVSLRGHARRFPPGGFVLVQTQIAGCRACTGTATRRPAGAGT